MVFPGKTLAPIGSTGEGWRTLFADAGRSLASGRLDVVVPHLFLGERVGAVPVAADDVRSPDRDDGEGDGVSSTLDDVGAGEALLGVQRPDVADPDGNMQEERGQEPGAVLVTDDAGEDDPVSDGPA